MHVLVVRQDRVGLGAPEVRVPDAEHAEDDRQVLLDRRGAEVLVHLEAAGQQLLEVIHADHARDRQADRAPQRVATADPIPELEHVRGVDAERGDRLRVRRQRDEVLRDRLVVFQLLEQPRARGLRVRDRLLRRERLRRDDEQRGLGIEVSHGLGEVRRVDVRDEVRAEVLLPVRAQRLGHHHRAEIRAADADVDDVGDRLPV